MCKKNSEGSTARRTVLDEVIGMECAHEAWAGSSEYNRRDSCVLVKTEITFLLMGKVGICLRSGGL